MNSKIFSRILLIAILIKSGFYWASNEYQVTLPAASSPSLLNVPVGFGKTHFIKGFPHATFEQEKPSKKQRPEVVPNNEKTVFFSPDDNVQQALIDLINREQKSIKVAIYTFTDKDIAQALIDAHNRGVKVQVVTDPSQARDRYSKCTLLAKEGIKIFEYDPNYISDMRSNLMHHKFAIFGCKPYHDCCVWTGSFNFTQAACKRNQENAVIVKDSYSVKRFSDQFEVLKQRCQSCKR